MQFLQHLFSPLGKVAGRAIYFANVLFFNGRLSRPGSSEPDRPPIFTKISGLVDGCKGLFTSLSFFDFSGNVAIATD